MVWHPWFLTLHEVIVTSIVYSSESHFHLLWMSVMLKVIDNDIKMHWHTLIISIAYLTRSCRVVSYVFLVLFNFRKELLLFNNLSLLLSSLMPSSPFFLLQLFLAFLNCFLKCTVSAWKYQSANLYTHFACTYLKVFLFSSFQLFFLPDSRSYEKKKQLEYTLHITTSWK